MRRNAAIREVGIALGILSWQGLFKCFGTLILMTCTPIALAYYYWFYEVLQEWWFVAGSGFLVSNIWAYFMPFMLTQSLKRKPTIEDLDEHPRAKRAITVAMHAVLVCLVTAFIEYFYTKYQNTPLSLVELLVVISGLTSLFRRLQINLSSFVLNVIMRLYKINPKRWKHSRTVVIFQSSDMCGAPEVELTGIRHRSSSRRAYDGTMASIVGNPGFAAPQPKAKIPVSASDSDLANLAQHTSVEILPDDKSGDAKMYAV